NVSMDPRTVVWTDRQFIYGVRGKEVASVQRAVGDVSSTRTVRLCTNYQHVHRDALSAGHRRRVRGILDFHVGFESITRARKNNRENYRRADRSGQVIPNLSENEGFLGGVQSWFWRPGLSLEIRPLKAHLHRSTILRRPDLYGCR